MKINPLPPFCLAVLCVVLCLGLWPFHSPANAVNWLPNRDGLHFGRSASVFSSQPLLSLPGSERDPTGATVEIWLQPRRIWDSGTILAFYRPEDESTFLFRQSQTDLVLREQIQHDWARPTTESIEFDDIFNFRKQHQPSFITIVSGAQGTFVYLDGTLAMTRPQFRLSAQDFTGRLILGDSPRQPDNWSGEILGVAIYQSQLNPEQVQRSFVSWKQNGHPELTTDERNVALYTFDEHSGNTIRSKAATGVDLHIPEKYQVVDKIALEPFWSEFEMTHSYWGAAVKNIVGFMPFGFCFYAWLATLFPSRRATLLTVLLGALVSITIEISQAFLPMRDSGTTDILTNTLGTWIGIAACRLVIPMLLRFFPELTLPKPGKRTMA
jgi:VanZ family protein